MKIKGEEILYNGKFLAVKKVFFENKKGQAGVWEEVQRKTFGKIVAIFALTREREVILEKIYRVPLRGYTIEFPAGLMDKPRETPAEVIKRELLEETGYTFQGEPKLILEGPFNAGMTGDELMIFFAENVEKVQESHLEAAEDIEVIKVPLRNLIDFVLNPPLDCKVDIKILSIVPLLKEKLREKVFNPEQEERD